MMRVSRLKRGGVFAGRELQRLRAVQDIVLQPSFLLRYHNLDDILAAIEPTRESSKLTVRLITSYI